MNFLEEYKIENEEITSGMTTKEKRILAIMCLERQFKAYENMSHNKAWNRTDDYRNIFNCCWDSILNDFEIEEVLWEYHEKIKSECVNKEMSEYQTIEYCYANIFAGYVETFLETLLDDTGNEEAFRLMNFDYILSFLNEDNEKYLIDEYCENNLIISEKKLQKQDLSDMKNIHNMSDVKMWCEKCPTIIM